MLLVLTTVYQAEVEILVVEPLLPDPPLPEPPLDPDPPLEELELEVETSGPTTTPLAASFANQIGYCAACKTNVMGLAAIEVFWP